VVAVSDLGLTPLIIAFGCSDEDAFVRDGKARPCRWSAFDKGTTRPKIFLLLQRHLNCLLITRVKQVRPEV